MSEFKKLEIIDGQNGQRLKVSFALFPNDRKGDNPKAPNVKSFDKETGIAAAGWTRESNGSRFISGHIEVPIDLLRDLLGPVNAPAPTQDEFADDIPF